MAKRHHVQYMHDSQMLFDAGKSWDQQAWNVLVTVNFLVQQGRLPNTLVGVWNDRALRRSEYHPAPSVPFVKEPVRQQFVAQELQGWARSDGYWRYLVEELQPAIDARYATLRGREHTFIMTSMRCTRRTRLSSTRL